MKDMLMTASLCRPKYKYASARILMSTGRGCELQAGVYLPNMAKNTNHEALSSRLWSSMT